MLDAEESAWSPSSLEEDGVVRNHRRLLLWSASASIAWIVFEVTANPVHAVAVGSLKPTISAIGTVVSGPRQETNRAKRVAEALFEIAWGLWQSTGIALGLMLGIVIGISILTHLMQLPAQGEAPVEFVTAALVMLFGAGLATMVTMAAIVVARQGRVRAWVGRSRNRVPLVAMLGLLGVIFSVSVAICWVPLVSPPNAGWWLPVMIAVEVLYFCVALPIIVLWSRDVMVNRITARWPEDSSWVDSRDSEALWNPDP